MLLDDNSTRQLPELPITLRILIPLAYDLIAHEVDVAIERYRRRVEP
jgi:hypothetical protein